ncbi:hypothetical protein BGZ63DRAFT_456992 [Mariannaea sp. PMI_226]|nr:hypothetical protein BGZ63DRAFT_456992 [Mariannaea sp. PMI_226]
MRGLVTASLKFTSVSSSDEGCSADLFTQLGVPFAGYGGGWLPFKVFRTSTYIVDLPDWLWQMGYAAYAWPEHTNIPLSLDIGGKV